MCALTCAETRPWGQGRTSLPPVNQRQERLRCCPALRQLGWGFEFGNHRLRFVLVG